MRKVQKSGRIEIEWNKHIGSWSMLMNLI